MKELLEKDLVSAITDKINVIVVVINHKGNVEFVSESSKRILGFEPNELMGDLWWKATRKNENSALEMIESFKKHVQENKISELSSERLIRTKDGSNCWILWQISENNDGKIVCVGYDITSRKQKELLLKKSMKLLKVKNKELLDSIQYASFIQKSILPNVEKFRSFFTNIHVELYPKDFVSGDFYFLYKKDEFVYIACIDCTGHGVPGALMTILSRNLIKHIIKQDETHNPAKILHLLDENLEEEINHNSRYRRNDGMDISLVILDTEKSQIHFSGAHHSLFFKNDFDFFEYKGDRYPIGLYHDVQKTFTNHVIPYKSTDQLFLFTDGFFDQFGGEKFKKFTKKRIYTLLNSKQTFSETCNSIENSFFNWKGDLEQTDDCLFMGFEL